MPRRKVTKRSFPKRSAGSMVRRKKVGNKKRLVRKNNYVLRPTKLILRSGVGIPDTMFIKLKYTEEINLQRGTPGGLDFWFRANAPYDPDTALGGKSAKDYALLASMYRYTRVYASRITFNFVSINLGATQVCITPRVTQQQIPFLTSTEDRRSKRSNFVQAQGNSVQYLKNFCTTKAVYGLNNNLDDDDHHYDFDNSINTYPDNQWYWYLQTRTAYTATDGHNVSGVVGITYYCKFSVKRDIAQEVVTGDPDDEGEPDQLANPTSIGVIV